MYKFCIQEIEDKDEKKFKSDMQAINKKAKVVRVEVKPRKNIKKKATKNESDAVPMEVSGDTVMETGMFGTNDFCIDVSYFTS